MERKKKSRFLFFYIFILDFRFSTPYNHIACVHNSFIDLKSIVTAVEYTYEVNMNYFGNQINFDAYANCRWNGNLHVSDCGHFLCLKLDVMNRIHCELVEKSEAYSIIIDYQSELLNVARLAQRQINRADDRTNGHSNVDVLLLKMEEILDWER